MTDQDRETLSRAQVLEAAVALADEIGMEGFTMRKLATSDVGPMTIYHHVPNKEAIVDGMVDLVFSEIERPPDDLDWKAAIRVRCVSAREVLRRHPWAPPLMESRTSPGPETLGHHESVLACLRRGGLSLQMTAHAYAIVDSFLYGFALEEAALPGGGGSELGAVAEDMMAAMPFDEYPHLAELTVEHVMKPGYDFGASFEFGLDLILDGIERAARRAE